jgi:DNA-directed RNA polymerase specialized sigma24 family protein
MVTSRDATHGSSRRSGTADNGRRPASPERHIAASSTTPLCEPPQGDWAPIIRYVVACVSARLSGEDSAFIEDVAHNAMARLREYSSRVRGTSLHSWKRYAAKIARSACADYGREKKRKRSRDEPLEASEGIEDEEESTPAPFQVLVGGRAAEDDVIERESLRHTLRAILEACTLTPPAPNHSAGTGRPNTAQPRAPKARKPVHAQRDYAIVLAKFDGLTNEEIAEHLGITVSTVSNALHRLRKVLAASHPEWDQGRVRQGPRPGSGARASGQTDTT